MQPAEIAPPAPRLASRPRLPAVLLLALPSLLLLPAALLAVRGGVDGLYGQDPFAYYSYAVGELSAGLGQWPRLPAFFWPPGYPLLVVLASLFVGARPLAGQLVSLLAGMLVPVFTAALAWEIWSAPPANGQPAKASLPRLAVPLLAGVAAACVGQLWQSSVVVMSDTAGLAAATLGVWALARAGRRGPGWLLLAAAGLAWATLTRWIYGLVALPCAAYTLWLLWRGDPATGRRPWLPAGAALLLALFILLPLLAPLAQHLLAPATGGDFIGDLEVYSWHPANAVRRQFVTADGLLSYRLPNGLYYAAAPAHRYYFTPLLAVFIVPGIVALLRRRARRPAVLLLLVGWAAIVYAFHAGAPWQNFRFALAYLPPLAVLIAIGAEVAWRALGPRLRLAVPVLLALGLGSMLWGGAQLTQTFITRKAADLSMLRQVESMLPADARLLSFGPTLTFKHYSRIPTTELYLASDDELQALLDGAEPLYLLVDAANLESQWREQEVAARYRALRHGPGLTTLAQFGPLTLFRVGPEGGS